jgi:hypothetical protein
MKLRMHFLISSIICICAVVPFPVAAQVYPTKPTTAPARPAPTPPAPRPASPPPQSAPSRPAPAPAAPRPEPKAAPAPPPRQTQTPPLQPQARPTPPVKSSAPAASTRRSVPASRPANSSATPSTGNTSMRSPDQTTRTSKTPNGNSGLTTPSPKAVGTGPGAKVNSSIPAHPAYKAVGHGSTASITTSGDSLLNHKGSETVVKQVNKTRRGLQGVNAKPLPKGDVIVHHDGHLSINAPDGRQYSVRSNGTLASYTAHGQFASFQPNGKVASLHTSALDVKRSANGARTIVSRQPDKSVLVSTGAHSGYLERTIKASGGTAVIQRTYVSNNVTYVRNFTTYNYQGIMLEHYVPAFYYEPALYGYAFYPLASPFSYSWGWAGLPWYGRYSAFFSPYAAYDSGYAWLTDYYLANTLAEAYDQQPDPQDGEADIQADQSEGVAYAPADTPITPELKNLIAQEVKSQLSYQSAVAAGSAPEGVEDLPRTLKPNHVYVVSSTLDVTTSEQLSCALSPGDVLQLTSVPGEASPLAALRVASSKRADCPVGAEVGVSLQDLQDMNNAMCARLDAALQTLHANQGQGGLPPAPEDAIGPPPRPGLVGVPAITTGNVAALLQDQQAQAKQTEVSVVQAVAGGGQ